MSELPRRYEYNPPTFDTEPESQPRFRENVPQTSDDITPEHFAAMRKNAQMQGFDLERVPLTRKIRKIPLTSDSVLDTDRVAHSANEQVEQSTFEIDTEELGPVVVSRIQTRTQTVEQKFVVEGIDNPTARARLGVILSGVNAGAVNGGEYYFEPDATTSSDSDEQYEEIAPHEHNRVIEQPHLDRAEAFNHNQMANPTEIIPVVTPKTPAIPARNDVVESQIVGSLNKRAVRKLTKADNKAEKHEKKSGKLGFIRGVGILAVSSVVGFSGGYHGVTGEMPSLSVVKTIPLAVMDIAL